MKNIKQTYRFTIQYKDKKEPVVYENVEDYSFPKDSMLWLNFGDNRVMNADLKSLPTLNTELLWIPLENILDFKATVTTRFLTKAAHLEYQKSQP